VLNFAGHFVSRESLLDCLNLAISVGESEELTNVFVEAGRMRELVDGLAISSRAILTANEKGASWRGRTRVGGRAKFGGKGRGPGENSGIWSVGGRVSSGEN
jgi:Nuclear pore protein 84 / 107